MSSLRMVAGLLVVCGIGCAAVPAEEAASQSGALGGKRDAGTVTLVVTSVGYQTLSQDVSLGSQTTLPTWRLGKSSR